MSNKKKMIITVILGILFGIGLIILVINLTNGSEESNKTSKYKTAETDSEFGEDVQTTDSGSDSTNNDTTEDESGTITSEDGDAPTDYETSPETEIDASTPREDFQISIEGIPDDVAANFPTSIDEFKKITEDTFYEENMIYYSKMTYTGQKYYADYNATVYYFYMDDIPECVTRVTWDADNEMYFYKLSYE